MSSSTASATSASTSVASAASFAEIEQAMVEAVAHLEVSSKPSVNSPTDESASASSSSDAISSTVSASSSEEEVPLKKLSAEEQELAEIMALKGKKVPLAPGHSHMHWMKHVRTLIRRPAQRVYTLEQVADHADPARSIWMALRGKVYDVTPYLPYHPGGVPVLMRAAGKDGTKMFDAIHAFVQIESMLAPLQIGTLAQ